MNEKLLMNVDKTTANVCAGQRKDNTVVFSVLYGLHGTSLLSLLIFYDGSLPGMKEMGDRS